jgi:ribonuclease P protein component
VTDNRRFRRRHRLLDSTAFSGVFKKAIRSRDRMFTVLYKDNGGQDARLGLAISRKHCKLAVGRNRLKRLVRESFRHHHAELDGLDIVVLNQPDAMRAGNKALFESLEGHWRQCHSTQTGRAE